MSNLDIRIELLQEFDKFLFVLRRYEHPHLPLFPYNDSVERQGIARNGEHGRLQGLYIGNGNLFLWEEATVEHQSAIPRNYIEGIEKRV